MRPKLQSILRGPTKNRFFVYSHNSRLQNNTFHRPQLPFLNLSSSRQSTPSRIQIRWISTENKRWIGLEIKKGVKYTVYFFTFATLFYITAFGIQQEYLEKCFGSPSEWTFQTRRLFRNVKFAESRVEVVGGNWAKQGTSCKRIIKRLEDPNIEGAGVKEQVEGGILVEGVGHTGLDITAKSEPWRRGYYDVLMQAALAAEHLDEWVRDKVRNLAFPKNTVVGPSNPNIKPVLPGSPPPPREEDCEKGFDDPKVFYMKIMTTKGFTQKQKVDAALAYASFLDFKGTEDAAREMIRWAMDIVSTDMIFDKSGQLNPNVPISANLLNVTTAMAIHQAKTKNLNMALPLFLSMLKARRSLPLPPAKVVEGEPQETEVGQFKQALSLITGFVSSAFTTPNYPAAPPDGTEVPYRDDRSICEEAGLMAYIGEILYATSAAQQGKEEGLAWTREAVDTAEDIMRHLRPDEKSTRKICKECLETGYDNWAIMVSKLADQEKKTREAKKQGNAKAWLWRGEVQDGPGRWESESGVVRDRMQKASTNLGLGNGLGVGLQPGGSSVFFL